MRQSYIALSEDLPELKMIKASVKAGDGRYELLPEWLNAEIIYEDYPREVHGEEALVALLKMLSDEELKAFSEFYNK